MNTSEYIPVESVAPIILEASGWPFFGGTGFFVFFPPFDDVFFITARHCVIAPDGTKKGALIIPYSSDQQDCDPILFETRLEASFRGDDGEIEDVTVYVVGNVTIERKAKLMQRALRLEHQDNVQTLIDRHLLTQERLRTVGFPSVSKEFDYDNNQATVRPRGFHGQLTNKSKLRDRYEIDGLNWLDGETEGFSGSPVLAWGINLKGEIQPIPIGMLVTGSDDKVSFLSINSATDLIAEYLKNKNKNETPQ